jgi:hypothetical protein
MRWNNRRSLVVAVLGLLATACGTSTASTRQPTPTPKATAVAVQTATATPTPAADTDSVEVLQSGVGMWGVIVFPVAIIQNQAKYHTAVGVSVTFTTETASGSTNPPLSSVDVNLAPGQTMALAADCTRGCPGTVSTTATVQVESYAVQTDFAIAPVPGSLATDVGGTLGVGDVTGTLSDPGLTTGAPMATSAACFDSQQDIIGGGTTIATWSGAGADANIDVAVIYPRIPVSCELYAAPLTDFS